jgi:hypothetical protein
LRGQVRVLLTGTDAAMSTGLKDLIQKLGLQTAFAPPTETSLKRYAMMKLLWHLDPTGAKKLAESSNLQSLKLETIQSRLAEHGVSAERIKGLRYVEVAPGHYTVIDPTISKEMEKKGFRFAYSTVSTPEHVHSILTHGQKATLTRWSEGALINGMSSMADVGSGGAQGVFSRLVTDAASSSYWTGRTFKIILKPELMNRLDIWGWPGDWYGQSWGLTDKNFGVKLLNSVGPKSNYQGYNEIISPVGNGTRYIAHVVATDETNRKTLIAHLKKEGYQPPDGMSLEQFVRLEPKINPGLLG